MKVSYFAFDIHPAIIEELVNGFGRMLDSIDSGSSNGRKRDFESCNAGSSMDYIHSSVFDSSESKRSPAPETTSKANFATIGGSYVSR
jgi:hypothetical protein